ncbi:uncharacterized protein LOC114277048 [Camellia sinensis]|uniref:uncharacterized protein LOC114277048 n=1 Tax=Camellia sinensis TaxID=4442 RepID=UPI00103675E7|nr:uncharacterized protein LOC114277048 [Camellia sinensis]
MFVARFVTNKLQPLTVDFLLASNISEGESLRANAKRYYEVFNRIPACNQELTVVSFKNSLDDECSLRKSLAKTLPKSMEELKARMKKYARAKEDTQGTKAPKQEKRNGSLKRGRGNIGFNRNQPYYRAPEKIPGEFMRKSLTKYCAYHNEDGHLTQGCRALKTRLEDLVRQGHLRDLVDETRTKEKHARLPQAPATPPWPPPQQADGPRVINVIHSKVNENEVLGIPKE